MPTIAQWANLLAAKIDDQVAYHSKYEVRYRNEYVLPFIAAEYAAVYGKRAVDQFAQLQAPKVGAAGITVDGLTERLTVLGAKSDDEDAAAKVETAFRDCDLDVMHREAHREALIKGRSFVQVDRTSDDRAVVGVETADQVAVHREQGPPYDVDAAMKVWIDEWTGKKRARLWRPGKRVDLEHGSPEQDPEGSGVMTSWRPVGDVESSRFVGVPVVEFAHMARPLVDPRSEIDPIDTLVDLADLVEGLMVFAGHFGAVPIRYGTGLSPLRDPKDPSKLLLGPDGKPVLGFDARADQFWGSTEKDARFGQLEPASLETFVKWAEHVSSRLRAKTSLASTYYSMDLRSHMSAELLKTDEAPMVRRLGSIGPNGPFGQAWRRTFALMLSVEAPGSRASVLPRWGSLETRIEAQATDAFVKVVGAGIGPAEAAKHYLDWSDEQIDRGVKEGEDRLARAAAMDVDPVVDALSGTLGGVGPLETPAEVKARFDALGVAIRAGVDPQSAAAEVGLDGVRFTGRVPVSLREAGE